LAGPVTKASGLDAAMATVLKSLAANFLLVKSVSLMAIAGDIAAGAGTVLHHYGRMQALRHALRDQPRQRVGDATRREGNHDGDAGRRGLRIGVHAYRDEEERGRCDSAA
jgi:hypothetical protein